MRTVCSRGYSIIKDEISESELFQIKDELTVTPYNPSFEQTKSFKLYLESKRKLYLPKFYGLAKFGPPELDKVHDLCAPANINFDGSLRPEQQQVVDAYMDPKFNNGGIINLYCGGGKTVIALHIAARLKVKTMIIVHKEFLLNQWRERIEQFVTCGSVGLLKGKVCDLEGHDIVLASLQSLSMKEYPADAFDAFGLLIVDECHHTSAEVFSRALAKVSCKHALGLSATLNRKDGLSRVFKWYLGDVVFKAAKRKDIVTVWVKTYYNSAHAYSGEHFIFANKPNMSRMINNICAFQERNEMLVETLKTLFEQEPARRVLLLSDRRSHLDKLHMMLKEIAVSSVKYYGGVKQEVLAQDVQVILATFAIASEGYDQQGLNTLVLASPKSDITQSIGRILRERAEERTIEPLVIDIADDFSLFARQASKRQQFYKSNSYNISNI